MRSQLRWYRRGSATPQPLAADGSRAWAWKIGHLISRQLFASPEVDATLDDDHSDIPFHSFLASTFLVRLDQEEDFAADLAEWNDEKLYGGRQGSRGTMRPGL